MDRGIRPLNVTLLTLLVTATISGVVAFGAGFPGPARWVVAVHGASALGLLLLAPAKIRVARRGLRRPGRSRKVISLTFTVLVLVAIGSGLLHAVGGWRPYLGLLPMQLHVGAAVGAVVLLVAHVVMHHRGAPRRWRPLLRRTDLTRRRALLGTGVVAARRRCGPSRRGCRVARPDRTRSARGTSRSFLSRSGCSTRCRRSRLRPGASEPGTDRLTWLLSPRSRRAPCAPCSTVRAVGSPSRSGAGCRSRRSDCGTVRPSRSCRRPATAAVSPPARPARCCWRRMPIAVRCRAATAARRGSSRRGGAGFGG